MKRANLIVFCVFLIFVGVLYTVTLTRPAVLAPFARLLPNKVWRLLEAISFLILYGLVALGIAKRKGGGGPRGSEADSTR